MKGKTGFLQKSRILHLGLLMAFAVIYLLAGPKDASAATNWTSSGTHSMSELTTAGSPYNISGSGTVVTISCGGQTKNSMGVSGDALFVVSNGARLIIQNGTFNGLTSRLARVQGTGSLTMNYVNVNNTTYNSDGSTVYLSGGAKASFNNCTFQGNYTPERGGVIFANGDKTAATGSITVTNSTFTNNRSGRSGGAISADYFDITCTGSTFRGNRSGNGGAIFAGENDMIIKNCNFYSNDAGTAGLGGALCLASIMNVEISGTNQFCANSGTRGAALYYDDGSLTATTKTLTISGTLFGDNGLATTAAGYLAGNAAGSEGGALYIGGTSNVGPLIVNMTNVEIRGNRGKNGGGIYAYKHTELNLNSCKINNNTATGIGGGIYAEVKLMMTNTSVSGNTAEKDGGGIWASIVYGAKVLYPDQTLVTLSSGSVISGNRTNEGNGGGILIDAGLKTAINQAQITNNHSDKNGGGIYNQGSLTVQDTSIRGNDGDQGGGVYNLSAEDTALYLRGNTDISYNACTETAGGGLFAGELSKSYVQGTAKIADNYMNVSAINTSGAVPTFTYSTGNAANNRSNAYLVYASDASYAALTVDGTLAAGAAFGVTSSDPVSGRLVAKPDGSGRTSLTATDLSYFTHDAKENGSSDLKTDADSTAQKNIVLAVSAVYNTVSFKNNYTSSDNSDAAASISVEDGKSAGASWPSNPSRAGYLFIGWGTVRSPLTDTSGKMYASTSTISSTSGGVVNKALTLYALWMEDADGNNIPDAMQVKVSFQAGTHGKLTAPAGGTFTVTAGVYTTYLWRGKLTDENYKTVMAYLPTAAVNTAVDRIRECVAATASLTADMIPGTTADSGYAFDAWTPSLENLPRELNANTSYTANFRTDAYTLTLDTHGVYPLLYSGTSSQDLQFTLKDGSGNVVTDSTILDQVTFTFERTDGFEKLADYDVVTLSGRKITAKKSGVVKIYAKYKNVTSTDFAVAIVPGDLDISGSIELNDAVQEAAILRGAAKEADFGTYGQYLVNMNNLPGVDVDDIVKIVAMVRNISDYYN